MCLVNVRDFRIVLTVRALEQGTLPVYRPAPGPDPVHYLYVCFYARLSSFPVKPVIAS